MNTPKVEWSRIVPTDRVTIPASQVTPELAKSLHAMGKKIVARPSNVVHMSDWRNK